MKRWIVRATIAVNACGVLTLMADRAPAQSAAAQELFDAAKKLTKEGKYAEACPKFEESQRLAPAPGTEFFLADCWEHIGRFASAWAAYVEVADQSKAAGQTDRERITRERATKLAAKLSRLTIVVPASSRMPGLVVKRDGVVLREPQWGVPVPVDPGRHKIEASAPGAEPWEMNADASGEGRNTSVEVPKLDAATGAAKADVDTDRDDQDGETSGPVGKPVGGDKPVESGNGQRTLGLVLGGVGVVGIAVGSYFGLRSYSKHKDYESHCPNNHCDADGLDLHDQAVSAGNISTIAFGVGVAALGTGVVLYLTAPKAKASLGVRPTLGPRTQGVSLTGAF
jgi:hypothetical protein